MHLWIILALAALFALADRLAGGDYIASLQSVITKDTAALKPRWLAMVIVEVADARSTFWASAALAVFLAVLGTWTPFGPKLALLALSFAAWRWEGWTVFGGAMDPKTSAQCDGLFWRHLLAVPAFMPALIWLAHTDHLLVAATSIVVLVIFALLATFLGALEAAEEAHWPGVNAWIELTRGTVLGLLVSVPLMAGA